MGKILKVDILSFLKLLGESKVSMLWKLVPALKVALLHCFALPLWLQSQLVAKAFTLCLA